MTKINDIRLIMSTIYSSNNDENVFIDQTSERDFYVYYFFYECVYYLLIVLV